MALFVAIYVRVSTDKQEAENQLLQLRAYCQKSDYEIHAEYIDVISGKESSRPAYDRMFADSHKKMFNLVLFWDLSRFSRAGTLFTLQKLKELENIGIEWESYQEPYFKSAGQFKDVVLSVIATVAQMEREKISERTKAGMERVKRSGVKLGRPKKDKLCAVSGCRRKVNYPERVCSICKKQFQSEKWMQKMGGSQDI